MSSTIAGWSASLYVFYLRKKLSMFLLIINESDCLVTIHNKITDKTTQTIIKVNQFSTCVFRTINHIKFIYIEGAISLFYFVFIDLFIFKNQLKNIED